MKLHKYKNYRQYVKVQTKRNKKKLHARWAAPEVMEAIAEHARKNIPDAKLGICHGAKHGWEAQALADPLGIEVIGTDISKTAKKFPGVIQWDFHEIKDEWLGNVDLIYSNSLDHSYDPPMCFDQWMKCLKPSGYCYIEWSEMHGEDFASEADPFGASEDEYRGMLTRGYEITEVMEFPAEETNEFPVARKVFVVRHRQ